MQIKEHILFSVPVISIYNSTNAPKQHISLCWKAVARLDMKSIAVKFFNNISPCVVIWNINDFTLVFLFEQFGWTWIAWQLSLKFQYQTYFFIFKKSWLVSSQAFLHRNIGYHGIHILYEEFRLRALKLTTNQAEYMSTPELWTWKYCIDQSYNIHR